MDRAQPLTVDLDEAELAQLAALAEHEDRTAPELAADAVRARLAHHQAYLKAIDEGLEAAAEGRTHSDEEFLAIRGEQRRGRLADDGP
jgi:predicted transcriptional regulator